MRHTNLRSISKFFLVLSSFSLMLVSCLKPNKFGSQQGSNQIKQLTDKGEAKSPEDVPQQEPNKPGSEEPMPSPEPSETQKPMTSPNTNTQTEQTATPNPSVVINQVPVSDIAITGRDDNGRAARDLFFPFMDSFAQNHKADSALCGRSDVRQDTFKKACELAFGTRNIECQWQNISFKEQGPINGKWTSPGDNYAWYWNQQSKKFTHEVSNSCNGSIWKEVVVVCHCAQTIAVPATPSPSVLPEALPKKG